MYTAIAQRVRNFCRPARVDSSLLRCKLCCLLLVQLVFGSSWCDFCSLASEDKARQRSAAEQKLRTFSYVCRAQRQSTGSHLGSKEYTQILSDCHWKSSAFYWEGKTSFLHIDFHGAKLAPHSISTAPSYWRETSALSRKIHSNGTHFMVAQTPGHYL